MRHGAQIVDAGGAHAGTVTSGNVSPTLGKPALMTYLLAEASEPLFALVRNQRHPLTIVKLPFVPKRYERALIA